MAGDALRNILLVMAALAAGAVWASIPPPPVNQYLGIPDTRFAEMTFVTCLGCHGAPESASAPLKSGYLPDRIDIISGLTPRLGNIPLHPILRSHPMGNTSA